MSNANRMFTRSAGSFFDGFLSLCPWIDQQQVGGNVSPFKPTTPLLVVPGQTNFDIIEMLLDDLATKATKVSAAATVANLNSNIAALSQEINTFVSGLG